MRNIENEADHLVDAVERFEESRRSVLRSVGYRANLTEDEIRAMVVILRSDGPITDVNVAAALDISVASCRSLLRQLKQGDLVHATPGVPGRDEEIVTAKVDPDADPWCDLKALEQAIDRSVAAIEENRMTDTISVLRELADSMVIDDRDVETTRSVEYVRHS